MPNLLTVSPGQIIEANDWNKVVDDLNMLTQALKIEDDWGAGQPAQGGDLSIKGQSNGEATLYLGAPSSGFFVKAKEDGPDPGLTIGAKNAGKGIVISVGGDTRIGGGNPSRAKLEIDGGDRWLNHPFPPDPSFNKPWSKSLLLTANAPSLTFNTNSHNTRFGMGMRKDGSDSTQLQIFSTTDAQLLADNNNGTGTYQSHLVIREDGRIRIGPGDLNIYTDTFMRLDVAGNTQINGRLYVAGSDFELGYNDGRNKGSRPRCRALAHTDDGIGNDNLIINVGGDFEGGVHVQGPKLIIDGNVGIGTAYPDSNLHMVADSGSTGIHLRNLQKASFTKLLAVSSNGITESQLQYSQNLRIFDMPGSKLRFSIDPNGDVIIHGNLRVRGNIIFDGTSALIDATGKHVELKGQKIWLRGVEGTDATMSTLYYSYQHKV